MVLTPRAALAWQHAFDGITPSAALAFASTGAAYTVTGVPVARDSALVDAGFDVDVNANARLGIGYVGRLASEAQDHGVKGNFRVQF
jgi:outer membrane autotransporter protein